MDTQEYEVLYSQFSFDQQFEMRYSQFKFIPNFDSTNIEKFENATRNSIYLFLLVSFLLAGLIAFLLRDRLSKPKLFEIPPITLNDEVKIDVPQDVLLSEGNKFTKQVVIPLPSFVAIGKGDAISKEAIINTPNDVEINSGSAVEQSIPVDLPKNVDLYQGNHLEKNYQIQMPDDTIIKNGNGVEKEGAILMPEDILITKGKSVTKESVVYIPHDGDLKEGERIEKNEKVYLPDDVKIGAGKGVQKEFSVLVPKDTTIEKGKSVNKESVVDLPHDDDLKVGRKVEKYAQIYLPDDVNLGTGRSLQKEGSVLMPKDTIVKKGKSINKELFVCLPHDEELKEGKRIEKHNQIYVPNDVKLGTGKGVQKEISVLIPKDTTLELGRSIIKAEVVYLPNDVKLSAGRGLEKQVPIKFPKEGIIQKGKKIVKDVAIKTPKTIEVKKGSTINVVRGTKVLIPNKIRVFEGHLPFIYTLSMETYDDLISAVQRFPNENNTEIGLYRIAHCGSDKRDRSTKRFYIAPPFDYFTESGVRSLIEKTIYAIQDGIKMPAAFENEGTVTIISSKVKKGLVKFYWEDSNLLVGQILYDPDYYFDPKNIFVEKAVTAKKTHDNPEKDTYHINLKDQNNEYVTFGTDKTDLKFMTYYTTKEGTKKSIDNTKSFNSLKVSFKINEIYLEIAKNRGRTKLLYEYKKGPTELIGYYAKSEINSVDVKGVIYLMLRYFTEPDYNKPLYLQLHPDICKSLSVDGHDYKTSEKIKFKISEPTLSKNGKRIEIKLLDFDVDGLSYFNVMYDSKILLRFVR